MTVVSCVNAFDKHVFGLTGFPMNGFSLHHWRFLNPVMFAGVSVRPTNDIYSMKTLKHFLKKKKKQKWFYTEHGCRKSMNYLLTYLCSHYTLTFHHLKINIKYLLSELYTSFQAIPMLINNTYQSTILANTISPAAEFFMAFQAWDYTYNRWKRMDV